MDLSSSLGPMNAKKWRSDYSLLLKCWSAIKTSELIKDMAYKQLKQFTADDKAIHRLKSFIERDEYKSSYEQSINLWNKTIDQFIGIQNYFAAAECLENLAELQLKYGNEDYKKESLKKFIRASHYYRRCEDYKRSIIALKRALIIAELSEPNEFNFIINSYEECSNLYELLRWDHSAQISHKTSRLFRKEEQNISKKNQMSEASKPSTPSTVHICSEDEDSQNSDQSFDGNNYYEEEAETDDSHSQMSTTNCFTSDATNQLMGFTFKSELSSMSCASNGVLQQQNDTNIRFSKRTPSQQLLVKNLERLKNPRNTFETSFTETSDSDDFNERIVYKPLSKVNKCLTTNISQTSKSVNTANTDLPELILNMKSEQKSTQKRKRRTKPKEESEELPEKRLIKLQKLGMKHNFIIDTKMPLKKLYCTLCEESIYSYRWSIITDHLKCQKHKDFSINRAIQEHMSNIEYTNEQTSLSKAINTCNNDYVFLNSETPHRLGDGFVYSEEQMSAQTINGNPINPFFTLNMVYNDINSHNTTGTYEKYSSIKPIQSENIRESTNLTLDCNTAYTPPALNTPELPEMCSP